MGSGCQVGNRRLSPPPCALDNGGDGWPAESAVRYCMDYIGSFPDDPPLPRDLDEDIEYASREALIAAGKAACKRRRITGIRLIGGRETADEITRALAVNWIADDPLLKLGPPSAEDLEEFGEQAADAIEDEIGWAKHHAAGWR
jgi:hypothetical protein